MRTVRTGMKIIVIGGFHFLRDMVLVLALVLVLVLVLFLVLWFNVWFCQSSRAQACQCAFGV